MGAACLLAVAAVGCGSGSPLADTASSAPSETGEASTGETEESAGGQDIEVVAKRDGAPRQPGYVWVGWDHTEQGLQDLWASFRLDGDPPHLSGEAVVLAATGESGSCPTRLTDTAVDGDTLYLSLVDEPAVTPPPDNYGCTSDFNPVTFVLRVERDLVERVDVVDFGDTAVGLGPAGQITHEDYGG